MMDGKDKQEIIVDWFNSIKRSVVIDKLSSLLRYIIRIYNKNNKTKENEYKLRHPIGGKGL